MPNFWTVWFLKTESELSCFLHISRQDVLIVLFVNSVKDSNAVIETDSEQIKEVGREIVKWGKCMGQGHIM